MAEVEREMGEAIRFHIDGLREDGLPIPVPTSLVGHVDARRRRSSSIGLLSAGRPPVLSHPRPPAPTGVDISEDA